MILSSRMLPILGLSLWLLAGAGPIQSPPAFAGDAPEAASPEASAAQIIEGLRSKDAGARLDAAKAASGIDSERLTVPLLRALRDKSPVIRLALVEALGARTDKSGRKKAAAGLAARVDRLEKKTEDRAELLASLEALRSLAQPGPIKGLIHGIRDDSDIEVVRARLNAVAAVPAKEAIERLIQFLGKGRRGQLRAQRMAAAKALEYATGQRVRGLGHDPDKWRAWWRENEKAFDFEDVAAARAEAARQAEEKRERKKKKKRGKGKGKGKADGGGDGSSAG